MGIRRSDVRRSAPERLVALLFSSISHSLLPAHAANEAARPGQLAATCRRCGLLFGSVRRLSGSASSLTWRTP